MKGKHLISTYGTIVNKEENMKLENANAQLVLKFKCNYCDHDNQFSCKKHLLKHVKKEHPDAKKEKNFNCKHCEKSFSTAGNLKTHNQAIHDGHESCKCQSCDKSYLNKYALFKHMKNNHRSE